MPVPCCKAPDRGAPRGAGRAGPQSSMICWNEQDAMMNGRGSDAADKLGELLRGICHLDIMSTKSDLIQND